MKNALTSWESMLDQEIIHLHEDYPSEDKSALLCALSTKENLNLRGLFLSCNPLTPKDLDLVASIVERANKLVYLNLSYCDIEEKHITAIHHLSDAIAQHSNLRKLSLSNNYFTHKSLPNLAKIMLNGTILDLDLAFNESISVEVGKQLLIHLQDPHCKIVCLNLVVTPLLDDKKLDKEISTQLNMNITRLLEQPENWLAIDIPESVMTFLNEFQHDYFNHTETKKMRCNPLACLKKRQLAYQASAHSKPPILYACSLAQDAQKDSQNKQTKDDDASSKKRFKT